MVGGLVQHKDVPLPHQKTRKVDAATLATRKLTDKALPRNVGDQAVDDRADFGIARPLVFGQVADNRFMNGGVVGKVVGLAQHAHRDVARADDTTRIGLEPSGKKRQQRGLAVSVAADNADAGTLVNAKRHVAEHRLRGEIDPDLLATKQKRHALPLVNRLIRLRL